MRPNHLRKLNEITLTFLRTLFLMLKRAALKSATGEIYEVDVGLFHFDAEIHAVFGSLAAGLEFDRVDFDADDEAGVVDAALHFGDDFEDDAAAVGEVAAVLVGAFVGC
jgi:hypothetical protein